MTATDVHAFPGVVDSANTRTTVSSSMPSVLLTRNELHRADTDPDWLLAVVTNALIDPTLMEYERQSVTAAADPTVYRVNLDP